MSHKPQDPPMPPNEIPETLQLPYPDGYQKDLPEGIDAPRPHGIDMPPHIAPPMVVPKPNVPPGK